MVTRMSYSPPKAIMDCIYEDIAGTVVEGQARKKDARDYGRGNAKKTAATKRVPYPYHCLDFTFYTIDRLKLRGLKPVLVIDAFKLPSRGYQSDHAVIEVQVNGIWHTIDFREGIEGRSHLIVHQGKHAGMFFEGKKISLQVKRINTSQFTETTKPTDVVPEMAERVKSRIPSHLARGDLNKTPGKRVLDVHLGEYQ